MNYSQEERNKRNYDLINILLMIIGCVPIFFAFTFIINAEHQSELLQEQTDTIEQLQKLYSEGDTSNELSKQVLENTHENEKLTCLRKIEFIKSSQKSISLKNDLIKLVSSFIIFPLLFRLLEDRKIKLKKTFKKTMHKSEYEK